jgi:hypothetical protein
MTTLTALNSRELTEAIKIDLQTGLVPFIKGSPGIGKSAMLREIARQGNLKLVVVHISALEPTDINGFPDVAGEHAIFKTFKMFPTEGRSYDINPETGKPYAGWLLFLDEFNSGSVETQAACYSVVLDKKVGQANLHPDCYIVCAGNLKTDNAIVNTQSSAITSRVVNYLLKFDANVFLEDIVIAQRWNMYVAGYLEFKPDSCHKFDPNFAEDPYACPRTWDMLQQRIQLQEDNQQPWEFEQSNGAKITGKGFNYAARHNLASAEGLVGPELGREFMAFVKTFGQIPTTAQVMYDATGIALPATRGLAFATVVQLRHDCDHTNLADIYPFVQRLDPEFRIAFLRGVLHDPSKGVARSHPVVVDAQRTLRQRSPNP